MGVGRLVEDQYGWTAGVGASDPGLGLQAVIQQSSRLQMPLWVLYIDLATFFPKIDRDVASIGEAVQGLPQEVIDPALVIYGKTRGEREKAVRCR